MSILYTFNPARIDANNLKARDCFLILYNLNILPHKQSVHLYCRFASIF